MSFSFHNLNIPMIITYHIEIVDVDVMREFLIEVHGAGWTCYDDDTNEILCTF